MTAVLDRPRFAPAGTADRVMERLFPTPNPYLNDPDGWATERLGVESWSIPRRIRESVRDHRYTAVPACHESAKTHTAATIAAWWVDTHPPGETLVFTTAPENHQVVELLWGDLQAMHAAAQLPGYITKDARWFIGDTLVARGKKTSDLSNPAAAMQSIQGRHALYPLVIIDEGGGVPKWLFDGVNSIVANDNGRVLVIGNPDDPASYFATAVLTDQAKWNVIPISAFDTPLYTGEPVSEKLLSLLIGELYVEDMRRLGEDSHLWQSKVLGLVPDISDTALYPLRLIRRAQANYSAGALPGSATGAFGVDVAAEGSDESVVYRNRGGVIRLVEAWAKLDTEESADRLERILAPRRGVPAVVDAVGVGKGVFDKLRRRGMNVRPFGGGERAMKPDLYPNRRTEVMWELRCAMEDGLVALDPEDLELETQLARIKWRPHPRFVCEIETKKEMRKRGVKSPDRVDAAAMAFATPPGLDLPEGFGAPVVHQTDSGPVEGSLSADLMTREM